MSPETTAVLLIGYQNDYFAPDGVLRSALEDGHGVDGVRERTSMLLDGLHDLPTMIVSTPIAFTSDYRELVDPVGSSRSSRVRERSSEAPRAARPSLTSPNGALGFSRCPESAD